MDELLYEILKKYYIIIEKLGYLNDEIVYNILYLIALDELTSQDYDGLLTQEDYQCIIESIYKILGNNCIIPLPKLNNNINMDLLHIGDISYLTNKIKVYDEFLTKGVTKEDLNKYATKENLNSLNNTITEILDDHKLSIDDLYDLSNAKANYSDFSNLTTTVSNNYDKITNLTKSLDTKANTSDLNTLRYDVETDYYDTEKIMDLTQPIFENIEDLQNRVKSLENK